MTSHAYPAHTHDSWTVLLIDEGCVAYDLVRHPRTAPERRVSPLPLHVAHDGRSASPGEVFRKRVLYLDAAWLPESVTGHAVDHPVLPGTVARALTAELHGVLARPEETWQAESLLLGLRDVLDDHVVDTGSPSRRLLVRWSAHRRTWRGRSSGRTACRRTGTS